MSLLKPVLPRARSLHETCASGEVLGRDAVIADLLDRMLNGQTVVLHGPAGIGKSTVLRAVAERTQALGRPCALSPDTVHLGQVVAALLSAYSSVAVSAPQRILRSRLRDAAQQKPGVLLLDHYAARGTPAKSYLNSLRGTGLGILIAVDTIAERDHAVLRAQCLSSTELRLSPLPLRHQRTLWRSWVGLSQLCVTEAAREAALRLAEGRPGYLFFLVEALVQAAGQGRSLPIRVAHIDVTARLALGDRR